MNVENEIAKQSPKAEKRVVDRLATVASVANGVITVTIDGSTVSTPAVAEVGCHVGDRVRVRIIGHEARVVGNITTPSVSDDSDYQYMKNVADEADVLLDKIADAADTAHTSTAAIMQDMVDSGAMTDRISAYETAAHDSLENIWDAGKNAGTAAQEAVIAATSAQNSLKSVVQGATTVEKAVSVMQTALESVVDYDPNTTTETFTGDGSETDFALQAEATDVLTVTVGGEVAEYTSATVGGVTVITFTEAPASGAAISVTYEHATVQEWFWHDANGAHVLGDSSGYRNDINSSGMNIVEVSSEDSVAQFGASGQVIGKDDESHIELDYHSMQLIDKENSSYFHVSDLRGSDGYAEITDRFTANGNTYEFDISFAPYIPDGGDDPVVKIDGVSIPSIPQSAQDVGWYIDRQTLKLTFQKNHDHYTPPSGSVVEAIYLTDSNEAKAFTFGFRDSNYNVGALSFAEGYDVVASGQYSRAAGLYAKAAGYNSTAIGYETEAIGENSFAQGASSVASGGMSHAEGSSCTASGWASHAQNYYNTASGDYCHAEGAGSVASGVCSHAEGNDCSASGSYSHAEGSSATAGGDLSHAEGYSTSASGFCSHAQNYQTIASSNYQTVIGANNIEDNADVYAAIIGNGSTNINRSNALAVRWDGLVDDTNGVTGCGVPVGTIIDYAGATVPTGWLECDGSDQLRADYPLLADVLGTTWGTPTDSANYFRLPDLRGRTAIGAGTGTASGATAHAVGSKGGEESHVLTPGETAMKKHSHTWSNTHSHVRNGNGGYDNNFSTGSGRTIPTNNSIGNQGKLRTASETISGTTSETTEANGSAHNNMQPYATVKKIIRAA